MIEFWEEIVTLYNAEQKCGLCWNFVGAGRVDYFNNIQLKEDGCCVQVGLLKFGSEAVFKNGSQGPLKEADDFYFELIVAQPSRPDIQFYNEDPDQDIDSSKYSAVIKPIIDCLGLNFELPCEDGFEVYEVIKWKWDLLMNFQDFNMDGIKVTGTIRKYI